MGMCSSWSGPGCWAQRRAPWVFSHSSAQLTLAGTLRGKRWRRQEVRAFREGKNRASAANGSFLGSSPPALCQRPQSVCTPCQLAFCSESPCFSLMPCPRFLDIQPVQPPPPTGYVFSALLHLSPLPPRFLALTSPGALDSPFLPPVQSLTSTRSSNFLGFVSSFTRCCWSTAPWLRHLRMLSAGG